MDLTILALGVYREVYREVLLNRRESKALTFHYTCPVCKIVKIEHYFHFVSTMRKLYPQGLVMYISPSDFPRYISHEKQLKRRDIPNFHIIKRWVFQNSRRVRYPKWAFSLLTLNSHREFSKLLLACLYKHPKLDFRCLFHFTFMDFFGRYVFVP